MRRALLGTVLNLLNLVYGYYSCIYPFIITEHDRARRGPTYPFRITEHDRARSGTYPFRITEHGAVGGTDLLPRNRGTVAP
jgi:hypothetical protein